jgi:hypothetical protein
MPYVVYSTWSEFCVILAAVYASACHRQGLHLTICVYMELIELLWLTWRCCSMLQASLPISSP